MIEKLVQNYPLSGITLYIPQYEFKTIQYNALITFNTLSINISAKFKKEFCYIFMSLVTRYH